MGNRKTQERRTDRDAHGRPPRPYRLTPAGLAALRRSAARDRPCEQSTGPRTAAGKAAASRNALQHGERSAEATQQRRETAALIRAMRRQKAADLDDAGPPITPDRPEDF